MPNSKILSPYVDNHCHGYINDQSNKLSNKLQYWQFDQGISNKSLSLYINSGKPNKIHQEESQTTYQDYPIRETLITDLIWDEIQIFFCGSHRKWSELFNWVFKQQLFGLAICLCRRISQTYIANMVKTARCLYLVWQ